MSQNTTVPTQLYDIEFRKRLIQNPNKYASELGYEQEVDFKVVVNTKDTMYIAFPSAYNTDDIDVSQIQAAGNVGSAGSAGSVSTVSTFCTTWSSAGTAGTASTTT